MGAGFGHLGLVDRAPHPNAAKLFANWLLSREGQQLWQNAQLQVSVRNDLDDSAVPPDTVPQPGVDYFDDTNWTLLLETQPANPRGATGDDEPSLRTRGGRDGSLIEAGCALAEGGSPSRPERAPSARWPCRKRVAMRNGFFVIDADGHVGNDEAAYRPYLEARFRSRPLLPRDNYDRSVGGKYGKRHQDPATQVADMDLEGIDVQVLYGTGVLAMRKIRERELAVALHRAYNDWLAAFCRHNPARPQRCGRRCPRSARRRRQRRELERAVTQLGFVGGMVHPRGPTTTTWPSPTTTISTPVPSSTTSRLPSMPPATS